MRPAQRHSLKLNVFTSLAGAGWLAVVQVVVVPVQLHLLGIEGYALIAFYLTLQGILRILDLGLTPTVTRELARYSVTPALAREARDFVRTFETVYWVVSLLVAVLVWWAAPAIADRWLQSSGVPRDVVVDALRSMGFLAALQGPLILYQAGLLGLERQPMLNAIRGAMVTLTAAAGIMVLIAVERSITLFFWSQIAGMALHVGLMRMVLWRSLPGAGEPARVTPSAFKGAYRFAAGMVGITACSLIITQADKLLLSKMLSLEMFGYYTLAGVAGSALSMLNAPIFNAILPRLTALVAEGKATALPPLFRLASQGVAVVTVPAAVVLSMFSLEILTLWTRDATTAGYVAPLLSIYIIGTALNSLMNLPYALQLAHGWTRLALGLNLAVAIAIVPALVIGVNRFGPMGAAIIWVATNFVFVAVGVPATHRRLFGHAGAEWFGDLARIVAVTVIVTGAWRMISLAQLGSSTAILVVLGAGVTATLAAGAVSTHLREWTVRYLTGRFGRLA